MQDACTKVFEPLHSYPSGIPCGLRQYHMSSFRREDFLNRCAPSLICGIKGKEHPYTLGEHARSSCKSQRLPESLCDVRMHVLQCCSKQVGEPASLIDAMPPLCIAFLHLATSRSQPPHNGFPIIRFPTDL